MRDDPEGRILRSMWHKGRKAFLPWTKEEIMHRAAVTPEQITDTVRSGLLKNLKDLEGKEKRDNVRGTAYEMTQKGIEAMGDML